MGGVIPSEDAFRRTAESVRHYESTYRDQTKHGGRRVRISECQARNEVWSFIIAGVPTGGSFDLLMTVNGSQETLTFNYNWTAAQVKTEFATHTELASADLDTAGGPFPDTTIYVEFIGDYAGTLMFDAADNAPVIDQSGLTGGTTPHVIFNSLIGGYPKNANP